MAYSYRYRVESVERTEQQSELERFESLRYVQSSIALLTGGCEICRNAEGLFCVKHKHTVKAGDPRCPDFARRFPEDPQLVSRAQAEQIVRETLGLTGRSLKRVTVGV